MKHVVIIPARYQSSRFPGKPLVSLLGREMVLRVWDRCVAAMGGERVYIATDDDRIESRCLEAGASVVRTDSACLTGTDRVFDASRQVDADVYINVQGDEPLVRPEDIRKVVDASRGNPGMVINAMCPITSEDEYRSRTVPKVVTDLSGRLLYMSRAPIPGTKQDSFEGASKQVCIYAFPKAILASFAAQTSKTPLEGIEDIEILRFLELGIPVQMIPVSSASIAVDIPVDVERVERALREESI